MKVHSAQLQESSAEDRLITADCGVVVLDGATSHDPDYPSAHEYVDTLGYEISERLPGRRSLTDILASAIQSTVRTLRLRPGGHAPSSTVAIVRMDADTIETLVLGDSSVIVGYTSGTHDTISDERLDALGFPENELYRERLQAGGGYSAEHFDLLRSLQRKQRQHRNQNHGYWIAEADPAAAQHAIIGQYPADRISWVVVGTDGAVEPLAPLNVSWCDIAGLDDQGLAQLLQHCHNWEAETDPDGRLQPRSKRHDDKTIAVVRPGASEHRA